MGEVLFSLLNLCALSAGGKSAKVKRRDLPHEFLYSRSYELVTRIFPPGSGPPYQNKEIQRNTFNAHEILSQPPAERGSLTAPHR
jgi:hypothetical protein